MSTSEWIALVLRRELSRAGLADALSTVFRETTDQEVVAFGWHSAIMAADPELLMQHADSWCEGS